MTRSIVPSVENAVALMSIKSAPTNRKPVFNEKCARRNRDELLLNEINELQHQRKIVETGSRIIAELEKNTYHK